jgi:nucleoid DNA-binding protein
MTKSELIARLAERLAERNSQLVYKDAELAVKTILDAMASNLAQGSRIEIRGFGSFDLNYRPPRVGGTRNQVAVSRFLRNMCRISRPARNCANGWICPCWSRPRPERHDRWSRKPKQSAAYAALFFV